MERKLVHADETREWWRYAITCGGQSFMQVVYGDRNGHIYSYVVRLSIEEHGGYRFEVMRPLLMTEDRQFGSLDDAIAVGEALIRQAPLHDSSGPA